MDDAPRSSPLAGTDFVPRLNAVERRLDDLVRGPLTGNLSDPDPGGTERWEQAQVWAHMAEFVPYWHREIKAVVAAYEGQPVPFGRTKTDPTRISGIETGRHEPISVLRAGVHESIADLTRYLGRLTPAEWKAVGLHPRRGEMDVEAIVGEFVVKHLEEHAGQLDSLG
jgi:hypothetical protein